MAVDTQELGRYLKLWRARLDPALLGFELGRRRTPGLRREEVALRAQVSPTWYTWLEQGRGGSPSPDVLDRIATVLQLSRAEREHLFLIAKLHAPEALYEPATSVTPRLQRVLDSLGASPAFVQTAAFDLVAWNRAAAAVMTDFSRLSPARRNLLLLLFLDGRVRAKIDQWEEHARFELASFRLGAARVGASRRIAEVIEELHSSSPEFRAMWAEQEVGDLGEGSKRILHPSAGALTLEYSAFAVDGRPDLRMIVYVASTPDELDRVRALAAGEAA